MKSLKYLGFLHEKSGGGYPNFLPCLKRILRSFHSTKATLHTASSNFYGKRFSADEKGIVENTGILPLNSTLRNPAIRDFLQRVDAEK
jgi:hypothetical protein